MKCLYLHLMGIKALLWNARAWKGKREELIKRMQNYDIGILTETKHRREDHIHIPGYDIISKNKYNNKDEGTRGVAISINRKLKYEIVKGVKMNSDDKDVCNRCKIIKY